MKEKRKWEYENEKNNSDGENTREKRENGGRAGTRKEKTRKSKEKLKNEGASVPPMLKLTRARDPCSSWTAVDQSHPKKPNHHTGYREAGARSTATVLVRSAISLAPRSSRTEASP